MLYLCYEKNYREKIPGYNALYTGDTKKLCVLLRKEIEKALPSATSKLWHGSPVWFINDNPVVAYTVRKVGVTVLFWSGQSLHIQAYVKKVLLKRLI